MAGQKDHFKKYDLENRLSAIKDRPRELYMPKKPSFTEDLSELKERLKSRDWKGFAAGVGVGPTGYLTWVLPMRWHKKLNKALDALVYVASKAKSGLYIPAKFFSGVSKLLYGLKSKSGKYVVQGATETLEHAKNIDHPHVRKGAKKLREILKYFIKFRPEKIATSAA